MKPPQKRHLLVIAHTFPPMLEAGVFRTLRFVRYLTELDWQITVLTIKPSGFLPTTPVDEKLMTKIPSSVVIERTQALKLRESLVRLKPRWSSRNRTQYLSDLYKQGQQNIKYDAISDQENSENSSFQLRTSSWQRFKDFLTDIVSIPDQHAGWLPFAFSKARKLHCRKPFDIIYSTAPPFTCHLIGLMLKKKLQRPWIADFRDPWVRSNWKREELAGTLKGKLSVKLESAMVRHANRIILNTDWVYRDFADEYGSIAASNFRVIPNGFDPDDFAEFDLESIGAEAGKGGQLVIIHTGALHKKRDPRQLSQALQELVDEALIHQDELKLQFAGRVEPTIIRKLRLQGRATNMVEWLPPTSHQQALKLQARADVLLLVHPDNKDSVPCKLYEYIRIGKPVLALTDEGATADLVRQYRLGTVISPSDKDKLKQGLLELVQQHRNGGIKVQPKKNALDDFNGRTQARRLHDILLNCLPPNYPR